MSAAEELTEILDARLSAKLLVVHEAFPQFFKDQAKTRDQMIEGGRIAPPNIP